MNETIDTEEPITVEKYRAELFDDKAKLTSALATIKAEMAAATVNKDHHRIAELSSERAEIIADIADIEADLRQLKQEAPKQQPPQPQRHPDLGLVVQLVAAEISNSGVCDVDEAIARLNHIKDKLSAQ